LVEPLLVAGNAGEKMGSSRNVALSGCLLKMTAKSRESGDNRYWSRKVTSESNALDLDAGVFTLDDPREIARSLKHSAESSKRRKSSPFRSAMSMLTFFINRAGSGLGDERRRVLEAAKVELRKEFGKPARK
jgi:putative cell wall-binding protein